MIDEMLRWIFSALVQAVFFNCGAWILRLVTANRVKITLSESSPFVVFCVSVLGFTVVVGALLVAASLQS